MAAARGGADKAERCAARAAAGDADGGAPPRLEVGGAQLRAINGLRAPALLSQPRWGRRRDREGVLVDGVAGTLGDKQDIARNPTGGRSGSADRRWN